jgi:hypothetical protein
MIFLSLKIWIIILNKMKWEKYMMNSFKKLFINNHN